MIRQGPQLEGVNQKSIEDRSEELRMEKDPAIIVTPAKQKEENEDRPVPRKDSVVKGLNIT